MSQIKQNELLNLSKFVVKENFNHHADNVLPCDYQNDINSIYKEEMDYLRNSKILIIKSTCKRILDTIRVLKWDYINPLPIQKMFGINPLECTNGNAINEIWYIGRFAIKRRIRNISLLKKLMVCAIAPVCSHEDNIAFAECDAKLLHILIIMGIKSESVGKSIDYLGSETIPVRMTYAELIDFYNKNKSLIQSETIGQLMETGILPNSVVFSAQRYNYPSV